jgi:hypothetical protein
MRMRAENENNSVLKKPGKQPYFLSYGREISIALLVKFLLLGGLWWLFFAGNKQAVDGVVIADKIFGLQGQVIISKEHRGILNDH